MTGVVSGKYPGSSPAARDHRRRTGRARASRAGQQRLARTLHAWLSMFSLLLVLFFGVTGFLLNHRDWTFGQDPVVTSSSGTVPAAYLRPSVDYGGLGTWLRDRGAVSGALTSTSESDGVVIASFAGPGLSASASVEIATGAYTASRTDAGWAQVFGDIHRGSATGSQWGLAIDASAWFLILVSLTGLAIGLLNRSRHWRRDVLLVSGGTVLGLALLWLSRAH